jgi:hypothetical protein
MLAWWGNRSAADYLFLPLYGVLVTSWYVTPIGALLGVLMHRYVRERSLPASVLAGAGIGLVVGVIVALLTVLWEQWPALFGSATNVEVSAGSERYLLSRFIMYTRGMAVLCALWIGTWAGLLNRANSR